MSAQPARAPVDVDALKASVDIVDVIGSRIQLKRAGKDYRGLCPFHADSNPSLDVIPSKQFYHCKSCEAHGNVLDFVMRFDGVDFLEAAHRLGAPQGERIVNGNHAPQAAAPEPTPEIPPPDAPEPYFGGSAHWAYHDATGRLLFYVERHDPDGDRKRYNPWTWCASKWRKQAWPSPRPLYRLPELKPGVDVVLVEGEKCADAATIMFPTRCAMTWPGGAAAVGNVDWSPLKGHKVYLWPDADDAGKKCRDRVLEALKDIATEVWVFNVSDMPEKWDIADALAAGWDFKRVQAWRSELVAGATRLAKHVYPELPTPATIVSQRPPEDALERATLATKAELDMSARHWKGASWRHHLIMGGKEADTPIKCVANCVVPFRHAPEWVGVLRWDEMAQTIRCARPTPWGEHPTEWTDHHDTKAAEWLDRTGLHYGTGAVAEAVIAVARENSYHPVREYLDGLKWDGKSRLDSWLTVYCGVAHTEYSIFAGRAMMVSAVARAFEPGVYVKSMLMLVGGQDVGKSEVFAILGGAWYGVQHGEIRGDAQKAKEQCCKLWIIEISELATMRGSEVEDVKSFISTRTDVYRPAYARHVQTIKRHCVFAGTSNREDVLKDTTGNVRFHPVTVGTEFDLVELKRDRDQLWAEAVNAYQSGWKWWATDNELRALIATEQETYMEQDEWIAPIVTWLDAPMNEHTKEFRLEEILSGALCMEKSKFGLGEQRRAGDIMRRLGFFNTRSSEGKRLKVWKRKLFP